LRSPPSVSGSEVVAAATMPPVGSYVSAFSVNSDLTTASRHSPLYVQRSAHSSQSFSVAVSSSSAAIGVGGGRLDGCQVRTKPTRWPSDTAKSAYVVRSRPYVGTSDRSHTESGPAMPTTCPSTRRTHGTISP
jgi:hypothetical protein